MHIPVFLSGALMGVSLLSAASAPAATLDSAGERDACTAFIDTLPTTIAAPGHYCLRKDLTAVITGGPAIRIDADNVALDCNGFRIAGASSAWNGSTFGVYAGSTRRRHAVRHCDVRGFGMGIYLGGAESVVEHNDLAGNITHGISVWGRNAIVRHNIVRNTGGARTAIGIHSGSAEMARVTDNQVFGVQPAGTAGSRMAYGISVVAGVVHGNQVSGLLAGTSADTVVGIGMAQRGVISGNTVIQPATTPGSGISGGNGTSATTVCRDNDVQRFTTAYSKCSLVGHNSTL